MIDSIDDSIDNCIDRVVDNDIDDIYARFNVLFLQ